MADSKISELAAAAVLVGTDELVIASSGATKKVTMSTLLTSLPMVLISDTLLGADTASFDFQSIPGTYKHLLIVCQARGSQASQIVNMLLRFNNDSGSNYDRQHLSGTTSAVATSEAEAGSSALVGEFPGSTNVANYAGSNSILIPNYAGTVFHKNFMSHGIGVFDTLANTFLISEYDAGQWRSTAAINRVTLLTDAGNWITGSRATLYGLN